MIDAATRAALPHHSADRPVIAQSSPSHRIDAPALSLFDHLVGTGEGRCKPIMLARALNLEPACGKVAADGPEDIHDAAAILGSSASAD